MVRKIRHERMSWRFFFFPSFFFFASKLSVLSYFPCLRNFLLIPLPTPPFHNHVEFLPAHPTIAFITSLLFLLFFWNIYIYFLGSFPTCLIHQ